MKITNKQIKYIRFLYRKRNLPPIGNLESMPLNKASKLIAELIGPEGKKKLNGPVKYVYTKPRARKSNRLVPARGRSTLEYNLMLLQRGDLIPTGKVPDRDEDIDLIESNLKGLIDGIVDKIVHEREGLKYILTISPGCEYTADRIKRLKARANFMSGIYASSLRNINISGMHRKLSMYCRLVVGAKTSLLDPNMNRHINFDRLDEVRV